MENPDPMIAHCEQMLMDSAKLYELAKDKKLIQWEDWKEGSRGRWILYWGLLDHYRKVLLELAEARGENERLKSELAELRVFHSDMMAGSDLKRHGRLYRQVEVDKEEP